MQSLRESGERSGVVLKIAAEEAAQERGARAKVESCQGLVICLLDPLQLRAENTGLRSLCEQVVLIHATFAAEMRHLHVRGSSARVVR